MAELYKGQAGSPITYLAADISASQTTINVADGSSLPDAPNIATIGYGENLETIKYETKSNGVLQNVTRGVEGTPRAWQKGTEVARFFTAYDHNAIIENFTSHLAESENRWIVESGSNSNGSYIKFGDGTMICTRDRILSGLVFSELGSVFRAISGTTLFPADFIRVEHLGCSLGGGTPTAMRNGVWFGGFGYGREVEPYRTSMWPSITLFSSQAIADGEVYITLYAIGKWKQGN